jgi:hypothetical protein
LAGKLSDPQMRAMILDNAVAFHVFRREWRLAQERAEEAITLANEQGFAYWGVMGTMVRGGALAGQEKVEEGITQMLAEPGCLASHRGRAVANQASSLAGRSV